MERVKIVVEIHQDERITNRSLLLQSTEHVSQIHPPFLAFYSLLAIARALRETIVLATPIGQGRECWGVGRADGRGEKKESQLSQP